MGFLNDAQERALLSGDYFCSQCGAKMEFEDENEDILVCLSCGHSVELDRYGAEDDEAYDAMYPTYEEVVGCEDDEEDDEEYTGEVYYEEHGELSDD